MSSPTPKCPAGLHEEASQWVTLLHSGAATATQRRDFARWLNASENHLRAYRDVEAFWQRLGPLRQDVEPELAAARAYLRQAQRRRVFRSGLALAASLLLAVAATPLGRIWLDNGVYRTAKGEQAHIVLSDGSRIDLNTDSELRVAYSWSARAVVLARGEALFTVRHDEAKPFAVEAAGGRIRDIGTQFNVYRQGDRVAVTVLEGEVSVDNAASLKGQALHPGMQLTYRADGRFSLAEAVDTASATAWREGRLVFKSRELVDVLEQLGRYHQVDLALADAQLRHLKVSGSFPTGDLDLVLNTIAASLPIKVVPRDEGHIALEAGGRLQQR